MKHISPSGITGTPTVSRIIVDKSVNSIGEKAVKSIDSNPHGNYVVDLKEDNDGNWFVTEIDSGKFHTTTPLWGYISTKFLKQEPNYNLPYLYTMLGLGEISDPGFLGNDIYPEGLHILRHIDLVSTNYEIETEILMKARRANYAVYSVPIRTIYSKEKSKIHPIRDTIRFFKFFIKEIGKK